MMASKRADTAWEPWPKLSDTTPVRPLTLPTVMVVGVTPGPEAVLPLVPVQYEASYCGLRLKLAAVRAAGVLAPLFEFEPVPDEGDPLFPPPVATPPVVDSPDDPPPDDPSPNDPPPELPLPAPPDLLPVEDLSPEGFDKVAPRVPPAVVADELAPAATLEGK